MPPFRSSRARDAAFVALLTVLISCRFALAVEPSASPEKKERTRASLTSIPLPIGQEAKGLVLPDFDPDGHLRARFEAGTARRTDTEHVEFKDLRMTTFTPQNTRELLIEMPLSTLNLDTQVIASQARTTVTRSDFTVSGDAIEFDTRGRKWTLVGNVKMVITDQSQPTKQRGR